MVDMPKKTNLPQGKRGVYGRFFMHEGKPVLLCGLQTQNSTPGDAWLLERELDALTAYHGNLLEAPVYWYAVEKSPGVFDFAIVKDVIDRCRARGVFLILLWFGTSKNGHPNYLPEDMKQDPAAYQVAKARNGASVASMSPLCEATLERDKRAFAQLMAFLKAYDGDTHTVMAVQVENEMGLANTDRDYSEAAETIYQMGVPEVLMDVRLEDMGIEPTGTSWRMRFGRYAHEAFSAWAHARFMNEVAKAGKAAYDLPMIINVMVGEQSYEEAGACYNAGAAVGRVLPIYRRIATAIDLIGPDMYVPDRLRYRRILSRYQAETGSVFIPESPIGGEANAMNMMEAFADFGCIGMACFGANAGLTPEGTLLPGAQVMAESMKAVMGVAPLLVKYRGTGRVHALCQQEFMDYQYITLAGYHVVAKFIAASQEHWGLGTRINVHAPQNADVLTARGRALLIQTGEHEFYLSGAGVKVDFIKRPDPLMEDSYPCLTSRQSGTLNFLTVEEGHFEGDAWVVDRCRNGDESNFALFVHRGETVRIRLNPMA